MKYRALFLDLDGTLLDTILDIKEGVNYSLRKHHLKERNTEEMISYLGHGSHHLISCAIGKEVDKDLYQEIFDDYKQYYKDHPAVHTRPYNGIEKLLKEFKSQGGKLCLITNKPHDIALILMDHYFPNMMDAIYGNKSAADVKPNPSTCFMAMEELNLQKDDVLYVGDSYVDYLTAKNAGLDYVLCKYGYERENELPNPTIDSPIELNKFLY